MVQVPHRGRDMTSGHDEGSPGMTGVGELEFQRMVTQLECKRECRMLTFTEHLSWLGARYSFHRDNSVRSWYHWPHSANERDRTCQDPPETIRAGILPELPEPGHLCTGKDFPFHSGCWVRRSPFQEFNLGIQSGLYFLRHVPRVQASHPQNPRGGCKC